MSSLSSSSGMPLSWTPPPCFCFPLLKRSVSSNNRILSCLYTETKRRRVIPLVGHPSFSSLNRDHFLTNSVHLNLIRLRTVVRSHQVYLRCPVPFITFSGVSILLWGFPYKVWLDAGYIQFTWPPLPALRLSGRPYLSLFLRGFCHHCDPYLVFLV